jgi:DNA polymerase-3 subunit epsilon
MSRFLVLDVETANYRKAICSVGIAAFSDGRLYGSWSERINPEEPFEPHLTRLHGIFAAVVAHCPPFPAILPELTARFGNEIVASHTNFDQDALKLACKRYNLLLPKPRFVDSYGIIGLALDAASKRYAVPFTHQHDAEEDARVTGEVLLRHFAQTGTRIEEYAARLNGAPSSTSFLPSTKYTLPPVKSNKLANESVVFTGQLAIPRHRAADLVCAMGATVTENVTRHTTMLIVGVQDPNVLKEGETKSAKERKAQELGIRILNEREFEKLAGMK